MIQIIFNTPIKTDKANSLSISFPFIINMTSLGAEKNKSYNNSINITISKTLSAIWGYSSNEIEKILFEFALREIKNKSSKQLIGDSLEISLVTDNQQKEQPFDANKIPTPNGYTLTLSDDKPKMGF